MNSNISVTKPLSRAVLQTSHTLFENFNIAKYITIGFCAWLATLGDSGFSFNYSNQKTISYDNQNLFNHYINLVLDHIVIVAFLIIITSILIVAFALFIKWLKCRGQFMFLNCAVKNSAEIVEPWRQFKRLANSYFILSIIISIVFFFLLIVVSGISILIALPDIINHDFDTNSVISISVGLPLLFILITIISLIKNLLNDFIVPIMYKKNIAVIQAINIFKNDILPENISAFALFYLMKIFLFFVFVVLFIIASLATCCIFCCLNAIPFVSALLWLPVILFKRYYSILFFEQFGDEWKFIKS